MQVCWPSDHGPIQSSIAPLTPRGPPSSSAERERNRTRSYLRRRPLWRCFWSRHRCTCAVSDSISASSLSMFVIQVEFRRARPCGGRFPAMIKEGRDGRDTPTSSDLTHQLYSAPTPSTTPPPTFISSPLQQNARIRIQSRG